MKQKLDFIIKAFRARLTKRILGPHVYAIVVKADNGLLAVDPEDNVVGSQLRRTGQWGGEG